MIIVLAGTTEGVEVAQLIQDQGWPVLASAMTREGAGKLEKAGIKRAIWGELNEVSLAELIQDQAASWLVDATHPFAVQIHATAPLAAKAGGARHIRLERPAAQLTAHPLVIPVKNLDEIEPYIKPGMKVFSTVGSRNIGTLASIAQRREAQLTARIRPFENSIQQCLEAGLAEGDLIMSEGVLSVAENVRMFRDKEADLVICKESGLTGGLPAKIEAALQLELPILIWERPINKAALTVDSAAEVLDIIRSGQDKA